MTAPVLDASAVLALIRGERGGDSVEQVLVDAVLPTANLAEVLAKHVDRGIDPGPVTGWLTGLGVRIEPVVQSDAQLQAAVRARVRAADKGPLSLGDRLCLAVALRLDRPAMTADRAWADLDLPLDVVLIR